MAPLTPPAIFSFPVPPEIETSILNSPTVPSAATPAAYADPAPFIRRFLSEQYAQMIARFKAAFGRALPHLPKKELSWRLHFIMGALSYTLAGTDAHKIISELNPLATDNDEILLRRLAPFLLAGLTAPLPDLNDVTREFDSEVALRR